MKNLVSSKKFQEVKELVKLAKVEARHFIDMYEVVEGLKDSRIQMVREKIDSEYIKTNVMKMNQEYFFLQTYCDSEENVLEVLVDNCEFNEGVAKIKNKIFSKRIMIFKDELVEITFFDMDNNFNDKIEILVKIEYSGNILVTIYNFHQCILFP